MKNEITFREAIREVLFREMEKKEDMIMLGESFHHTGSLFSMVITPKFHKIFGDDRVLETPVAENGIIGIAFGAALAGMTVVPEIWSADFLLCTGSEIVNAIPKWRYQHRYKEPINLVIRASMGLHTHGGGGPEHSQCPEAYLHNAPGLVIVAPSTVRDGVGLLRNVLKCGDPVLYLEHRQVYDITEKIDIYEEFTVPIGKACVALEGKDITIVAWSLMRLRALEAAKVLKKEGISVEIVDPRTIKPMDMDTILKSVEKTGKLLVVEEAPKTGSIAGEIFADIAEQKNGVKFARLTMPDIPYHYLPEYEFSTVPSVDNIVEKVEKMVK